MKAADMRAMRTSGVDVLDSSGEVIKKTESIHAVNVLR